MTVGMVTMNFPFVQLAATCESIQFIVVVNVNLAAVPDVNYSGMESSALWSPSSRIM
jgi:hypothetical protein